MNELKNAIIESIKSIKEDYLDGEYKESKRDLFDIFDKNNIFIEIKFLEWGKFYFDISIGKESGLIHQEIEIDQKIYPTRTEAELEAFKKAFEIWESKQ